MFPFFALYHLMLSVNFMARKFGMAFFFFGGGRGKFWSREFLGFVFNTYSIIPVTLNPVYPPPPPRRCVDSPMRQFLLRDQLWFNFLYNFIVHVAKWKKRHQPFTQSCLIQIWPALFTYTEEPWHCLPLQWERLLVSCSDSQDLLTALRWWITLWTGSCTQ